MTDDAAAIRAVLREHGHEVPDRGRISREDRDAYNRIISGNGAAPSYDAGVGEDDFVSAELPSDADDQAAELAAAERKPRRVRPPRAARGWRPGAGKDKRGKPRRARPRVPVDRLIERGWEMLARVAAPVSVPVARTLDLQAPVAGLILEDVVRGTIVDKALQPVARAEEKAEKVLALAGPPILVAAIESAYGLPDQARDLRLAILRPMLTECLTLWVEIAEDKIDIKRKRDEELGPVREKVEALVAAIFAAPVPAQPQAA